ncbi:MAG: hypothetical protein C0478_14955 [Planctomyces sp.]|jgi:hypothetical protein|nr:hypothetical protein [Planctomyces sp.]
MALVFGLATLGTFHAGEAFAQAGAKAQPATKGAAAASRFEDKTLITKDGIPLRISYFAGKKGKDTPVVVLLHGKKGSRQNFNATLAPLLNDAGYAVVTVDLRGHGETPLTPGPAAAAGNKKTDTANLKPRDYSAMVPGDMEAVKKFLFDEHMAENLNMSKLAILGAEFSTAVALAYTELDWSKIPWDDAPSLVARTPRGQDVRALILLSPEGTLSGININQAETAVRVVGLPVLIGVGSKDTGDKGAARKMAEKLNPDKKDHIYLETYEGGLRGTGLLGRKLKTEDHILAFLDKYLGKSTIEWRDRRSRLER